MSYSRILLILLLATSGWVWGETPRLRYAVVPVQITGDYQPVSTADFMQSLLADAKQQSPDVSITVVDVPQVKNWSDIMPPDPAQVKRIIQGLGVDRLVWGSVRFRKDHSLAKMGGSDVADTFPGQSGSTYRYILTVGGVAKIFVADGESGKLLLDDPVAMFRSEMTVAPEDTEGFQDAENRLARRCSADLAEAIVTQGKRKLNPQR